MAHLKKLKHAETPFSGRRGSAQVDTLGGVLILAVGLSLCMSALGAMSQKFTLDAAANSVKRIIETDGRYDAPEQAKIADFLSGSHVSAAVTVTPSKSSYNLGDTFTVKLTAATSLGAGSVANISFPIYGYAAGSCEVYTK
jgi:hypothetical protein